VGSLEDQDVVMVLHIQSLSTLRSDFSDVYYYRFVVVGVTSIPIGLEDIKQYV
jgi:hypothetical protein